ncbi:MAG: hypothetical protein R3B40_06555 [Polyangiales bacterium]
MWVDPLLRRRAASVVLAVRNVLLCLSVVPLLGMTGCPPLVFDDPTDDEPPRPVSLHDFHYGTANGGMPLVGDRPTLALAVDFDDEPMSYTNAALSQLTSGGPSLSVGQFFLEMSDGRFAIHPGGARPTPQRAGAVSPDVPRPATHRAGDGPRPSRHHRSCRCARASAEGFAT